MPRTLALASALLLLTLPVSARPDQTPRPKSWVRVGALPYPTKHAGFAFDPLRDRVILYGGYNAVCGTWEWDSRTWTCVGLDFGDRVGHRLIFDETRSRVLFIGVESISLYCTVREYRGNTWLGLSNSAVNRRERFGLAWDSARQRAVLFGGAPLVGNFARNTWEWDGTRWNFASETGPLPRWNCAMAYDAARNKTVLFGGQDFQGRFFTDTWEWNGTSWHNVPAAPPPQRVDHAMVYSPQRQLVLIHGGLVPPLNTSDQTWAWNGTAWSVEINRAPSTLSADMVYDSLRYRTLLFTNMQPEQPAVWALPDCPGDANADGATDFADLNIILNNFGQPAPLGLPGDLDGNGTIDAEDLNQVLTYFGLRPC
ncbi:MAG: hypothetical protein AB7G17_11880 [Phycisphaerales bacterium]